MPRRSRWVTFALPLALVLVVGGAPAVVAQNQKFDRIEEETAELRELPIEAAITETILTPDEVRQRMPALIERDYPAAEAAADARGWEAFGLLPADTDLAALVLRLYQEQTAGFYDPTTDEMVVVSEDDELGAAEEWAYSHEVVHALQDQNLGLGEITEEQDARPDDEILAITALVEGDAMAASIDYLLQHPGVAARMALEPVPSADLLDAVPPFLAVQFYFPYIAGPEFVAALRAEGDWAAVDAAYTDLPASTEQILHPEKYVEERDEPEAVALPDLGPVFGDGWSVVDESNLGELQIGVLFAGFAPDEGLGTALMTLQLNLPEAAREAAAGWDGDRYALWARGDEEVLVWRTAWDSEEDARVFSRALQHYDEVRFDSGYEGETPEQVALATDERTAVIEREGVEVRYVLAPDRALADEAMAALRGA